MDDIAGPSLALGQIVFLVWVTLSEHKWIILAERRGFRNLYRSREHGQVNDHSEITIRSPSNLRTVGTISILANS